MNRPKLNRSFCTQLYLRLLLRLFKKTSVPATPAKQRYPPYLQAFCPPPATRRVIIWWQRPHLKWIVTSDIKIQNVYISLIHSGIAILKQQCKSPWLPSDSTIRVLSPIMTPSHWMAVFCFVRMPLGSRVSAKRTNAVLLKIKAYCLCEQRPI
jgi:hypothetical protein